MTKIGLYVQYMNRRALYDGQEIQVGAKINNKTKDAVIEGCVVDGYISLTISGDPEVLPMIDVGSLIEVDLDP